MKKSTIIIACVLTSVLWTYLSFAKAKPAEEMGRDIAQAYLESSLIDENWSSSHPYIAAEASYLTDKDTPSYKEYKVSCDDNANCGWIIVNIDGDDVAIPAASTQGSANFELLNAKLDDALVKPGRGAKKARQLYYFSPFDQAIEDQDLNVATLRDGSDEQPALDKLKKKIADVKAIKQSDAFKQKKAEFEDKGLTSFARRSPLAMLGAYASATTIPDTFVPGASTSMCGSRIPCYKYNATYNYSGGTCQFGCVATALAMIYGYHDRQATYPNLITWGLAKDYIDSSTTDAAITTMINTIRTEVGTTCSSWVGLTPAANGKLGIDYAKSKGYTAATSTYEVWGTNILLAWIKFEINASRPVLVGIQNSVTGHAIVAYGYSSDTTSRMIRVNYGGGRTGTITLPSGTVVPSYNADINVDSVSLSVTWSSTAGTVTSITRIKPGG